MMTILLIIVIILLVAFIISTLISRKIEKLSSHKEERIREIFQTEEGRQILHEESEEREKKTSKLYPIIFWGSLICYSIMLITGIAGIYLLIVKSFNNNFLDIIFENKGYYLISPAIIVFSIYNIVRVIKMKK